MPHIFNFKVYVFLLAFPAWLPGDDNVLCAKFAYFYQPECFDKHVKSYQEILGRFRGIKKLQGN
jgi:hypothetical protein